MFGHSQNRPVSDEAQVRVARLYRQVRERDGRQAGAVQIELLRAEVVEKSCAAWDDFRARHVPVKGVGHLPVRDMQHAVIETGSSVLRQKHGAFRVQHRVPTNLNPSFQHLAA